MLFIGEQAVLIEVQQSTDQYLIGNEIFATLPTKILNKIQITANWNRALRYLNDKNEKFNQLGFALIRFDLYLKDELIICLSKNSFEQKILNQTKFQNEFLSQIFNFRNRNQQLQISKPFPQNFDLEVVQEFLPDLNRCWISDNFPLKNHKFKILFKQNFDFKIEKTKYGQVIYYSNFDFQNWDLFDLKSNLFYQEGRYQFNVEVCLKLISEKSDLKIDFLNHLIIAIQTTHDVPEQHKNWHLFNVTNDYQYLVTELKQIFEKQNLIQGLDYLEGLFKELQNNYFSILFANLETKKTFFQFIKNSEEKTKLQELISRYGIFNSKEFASEFSESQ